MNHGFVAGQRTSLSRLFAPGFFIGQGLGHDPRLQAVLPRQSSRCRLLLLGRRDPRRPAASGGPINAGSAPFPSQFIFPGGQMCRNFDQLATTCQQNWQAAVDLLKQGFFSSFLGGLGRADLAMAANEAAKYPDPDRGLDQLLAKLPTQVLQPPKVKVEPSEVNLGILPIGDRSQPRAAFEQPGHAARLWLGRLGLQMANFRRGTWSRSKAISVWR